MTRTEMMAELLEVLNDASIAGVFTPSTLYGYLSEGQDKFCEDTGYFMDLSSFTLTLVEGTAVYPIPDRVIQIIDIWDGARRLQKVPTGNTIESTESFEPFSPDTPSTPSMWRTDQETGVITLIPAPAADDAGDTLVLQARRYSLKDLAEEGNNPEIPGRFHRACIEWAAYKAFNHHDMETQDPVKAKDHKDIFKDYVKDGKKQLRRYQNQETRVGTAPAYRT